MSGCTFGLWEGIDLELGLDSEVQFWVMKSGSTNWCWINEDQLILYFDMLIVL